jgi:hypothetical protein
MVQFTCQTIKPLTTATAEKRKPFGDRVFVVKISCSQSKVYPTFVGLSIENPKKVGYF